MIACVQNVYEKASSRPAAAPASADVRQPAADVGEQPDGDGRPDGGEQVQPARGIGGADGADERARERVVERIGLSRAGLRPEHGGLKAAGVAEVDAGQQRPRVGPERDRRDDARRRRRSGGDRGADSSAGSAFARTFPRDERANVVDAARVQHVTGLDPAAPCGADAESHLPRERVGPMAVAVDRDA